MIYLSVQSGDEDKVVGFTVPSLPGPSWLIPSIERAGQLLLLRHDWDQQIAPPIDSTLIRVAINRLDLFMSNFSPLPQSTPTQRSGVQLDWHEEGIDLEITLDPGDREGYVVFSDQQRALAWDGPLGVCLTALREVFAQRLSS